MESDRQVNRKVGYLMDFYGCELKGSSSGGEEKLDGGAKKWERKREEDTAGVRSPGEVVKDMREIDWRRGEEREEGGCVFEPR